MVSELEETLPKRRSLPVRVGRRVLDWLSDDAIDWLSSFVDFVIECLKW